MKIRDDASAAYDAAPNDIVRQKILGDWTTTGICTSLKSSDIKGWTGTISSIESGGNFEINLGDGIEISASFDPNTPLFDTLAKMKIGQGVQFSGSFVGGDDTCPLVLNTIPADQGAIDEPRFTAEITAIHRI